MSRPVGEVPWFRSLYFRTSASFVVFLLGTILVQSLIVSQRVARSNPFGARPNELAVEIAAEAAAALAVDPKADLVPILEGRRRHHPELHVVLTDGRVASVAERPLPEAALQTVRGALHGGPREEPAPDLPVTGPVVTAPIHVSSRLLGLVVLPPPQGYGRPWGWARLVTLPGTLLLVASTILAAYFVFAPARRRLSALERAALRMGDGDLTARAPEEGQDEVSRVSRAFNAMGQAIAEREAALRRSDQGRRQMLADVSHELKTPLTAIRAGVETLQMPEGAMDASRRAAYLSTLARETQRLERIVADLLALGRYEGGGTAIEPRVFAPARLFAHVALRHRDQAAARGVELRQVVAGEADQIVADPDRVEQVVDNLVANALRHTPDGGAVEMQAGRADGAAVLTIADSGEGIAPEHLPHVFDRFYKVDPARAGAAAGSGLGLAICKAIVVAHGGTIVVTSRPGGTVFTITLPQPKEIEAL
jgi:signal transduction histidine kinase